MKELIDKISTYNIFNYLLPGVLYCYTLPQITSYNLIQEDMLVGAFLYYFIGMVISRVGSVIIEPLLKKISFVKFSDYKSFVIASKKDDKIELFSMVNNTYRTIIATILLLALTAFYQTIELRFQLSNVFTSFFVIILLFTLFLFSYRKQTQYINRRIDANQ